ncbi:efflux RND transporter permease subunit [Acidomonas methanolica]|uniref:efflux RND transporter permease subunit n=1 Tax=Acidomonas methanolica TaxID=437 RepID=UPI002119D689|nr:efflux RND transporter permease subunit [Acidomonas methanolica]MCQ9156861.1 efflux RND transporter permease subunit [Acidomonas methanolica]
MISKFFIERPVFANVIAVVTILLGVVGLFGLPVSQYPDVVPPTVQVATNYPGASATTIARTVALPIEQQVNGVQGMLYMQSTSTDSGAYTLTVTFRIGTDPNQAQILVQNRVSIAMASLPQSVQVQGVTVQKRSTNVLGFVALTSPDHSRDSLYLSNYATIHVIDALSRVPGVGNISVMGASQYAMRIWFDPELLQAHGLQASDVMNVIEQQSQIVPSGQFGSPPGQAEPFQYTLEVPGRLAEPGAFGNLIIKTGSALGGQIVRLRDVARVELGAKSYAQDFQLNGKPAIGIGIYATPEANGLATFQAVRREMGALSRDFPPGVAFEVPFDTTTFVSASIDEVYKTLIEAAILVLIVVLVFLQDWRAMMVPATTVPVTIIGAFAAMAAMGFGVNISTLLAIVLAIGIVVDDAIVVVEGVAQQLERGLSGRDAAVEAMKLLVGPIIGITLVLMSVFIPAAFLAGLTGRMYAQFALVIAATAAISAVNALTLKPTQCATWMRQVPRDVRRNAFYRAFNRLYAGAEARYVRLIHSVVGRPGASVLLALGIIVLAVGGLSRLPTGFLPLEDQGYFVISVQLPSGASLARVETTLQRISSAVQRVPGVDNVVTISGMSVLDNSASLANAGTVYVVLKDWSQRRGAAGGLAGMYQALGKAVAPIHEASVRVVPPPAIQGIGNAGGFTMQLELRDGTLDWSRLQAATAGVVRAGGSQSAISRVFSTYRADAPQYVVSVDRDKAATLGVSVQDVFEELSYAVGSGYAGQFDRFNHVFQVYIEAQDAYRLDAAHLGLLRVRNSNGGMVPLGSLVQVAPLTGPSLVTLYNLYPSATLIGSPGKGFSSGDALTVMEQAAAYDMPPGLGYDWTAMSYQERAVGGQIYLVFGLGILMVYLVLAAQYESWIMPVAVISAVPLALTGPAAVISLLGIDNNLYTQIGLILLVALSAKNAILIVEMARELRDNGRSIVDAAAEAARIRFRPILMTSIAFSLGVLPLVTASGAGANARKSIGIATLSGMISSTCLAVVLVPAFFVVIRRFEERRKKEPAHA